MLSVRSNALSCSRRYLNRYTLESSPMIRVWLYCLSIELIRSAFYLMDAAAVAVSIVHFELNRRITRKNGYGDAVYSQQLKLQSIVRSN